MYFRYKWLISSWSKCSQPISNASVQCGGGLQYRNITCIEIMTGKFMDPSICRILDTPPTIQRLVNINADKLVVFKVFAK